MFKLRQILTGLLCLMLFACSSEVPPESIENKEEQSKVDEPERDLTEPSVQDSEKDSATEHENQVTGAKSKGENTSAKSPLIITVENLQSHTAPVEMSIYETAGSFLEKKAQLKKYRFTPVDGKLKIEITDVPYGEFAIAMYQDLDNDNEIDKNLVGLPAEPYAFSNNVRPKIKLPSFDECKFRYADSTHTFVFTLID